MSTRPFISYAREDREVAILLHAELVAAGSEPWLDAVNLIPGEDWPFAIDRALAEATPCCCVDIRTLGGQARLGPERAAQGPRIA